MYSDQRRRASTSAILTALPAAAACDYLVVPLLLSVLVEALVEVLGSKRGGILAILLALTNIGGEYQPHRSRRAGQ